MKIDIQLKNIYSSLYRFALMEWSIFIIILSNVYVSTFSVAHIRSVSIYKMVYFYELEQGQQNIENKSTRLHTL